MDIGETLYVKNRTEWRSWLQTNHDKKEEIWLIYFKKDSGIPFIPYDDAVEEALCFGWIDSIVKKHSKDSRAQRFSVRKTKSFLSELNKERIRRLMEADKMTVAGIDRIKQHMRPAENGKLELIPYKIPEDIIKRLKEDDLVWQNYQEFPEYYKTIRIAFIDTARKRPEVFEQRLRYFMEMTAKNKRYGTIK